MIEARKESSVLFMLSKRMLSLLLIWNKVDAETCEEVRGYLEECEIDPFVGLESSSFIADFKPFMEKSDLDGVMGGQERMNDRELICEDPEVVVGR